MAIRDILPGSGAFGTAEGPLGITDNNLPIVDSLSKYSLEIDEARHSFNQNHWRCYFKRADVCENGRELFITPLPSKEKMRRQSRTKVHTSDSSTYVGDVKKQSNTGRIKVDIWGKLLPKKMINGIDVECFNELNIRLKETKCYAISYFSGECSTLNTFQQFFLQSMQNGHQRSTDKRSVEQLNLKLIK